MKITKILLVDDNLMIRKSIKKTLLSIPQIKLVGECADGGDVMPFLAKNEVDVIFLDIIMQVMDGFEAARITKAAYPHIKIIAFSSLNHLNFIEKMTRCGADGFVSKFDVTKPIIIDELEKVGMVF